MEEKILKIAIVGSSGYIAGFYDNDLKVIQT